MNEEADVDRIGQYYISFHENSCPCCRDALGIPMVNCGRRIGRRYDARTVEQWGLSNHDLFKRTGSSENRRNFITASDWICDHLNRQPFLGGSDLGQGISLLVRVHVQTGEQGYREAADRAFAGFRTSNPGDRPASKGSVDAVSTRSLSGFIWSTWGLYDYFLANGENVAGDLFARSVSTLASSIDDFDLGFWSLYENTGTTIPRVANRFYHELHTNQMRVMHRLTGAEVFANTAERWGQYAASRMNRARALGYRLAFECCTPG